MEHLLKTHFANAPVKWAQSNHSEQSAKKLTLLKKINIETNPSGWRPPWASSVMKVKRYSQYQHYGSLRLGPNGKGKGH